MPPLGGLIARVSNAGRGRVWVTYRLLEIEIASILDRNMLSGLNAMCGIFLEEESAILDHVGQYAVRQ